MAKGSQHVVPKGGKWAVRSAGAARATGIFETQREAVTRARDIAQNHKTELFIHGRDGRIRERDSFAGDPFPPKG